MSRKSFIVLLVIMMIFGIANSVMAEYPEREIEWVIWSSPGGGSDATARTIGIPLRTLLGVPLVVVNMPGGDGARAITYVQEKPADGYSLLFITGTLITAIERGLIDYTLDDFETIMMLNYDAETVTVANNSPIQTLEELIELGKQRSLKWGMTGLGDSEHIHVDTFARRTGIQYDPVVFGGGGESMAALLGGTIDVIAGNPSEVMGQVEAGNVRVLATMSENRLEDILPGVPTVMEKGYDVVCGTFRGVAAKKGTPPEVIKRLSDNFIEAGNSELYKNFLKSNAMDVNLKNAEEFDQFIEEEYNIYVEGLKALKIIE